MANSIFLYLQWIFNLFDWWRPIVARPLPSQAALPAPLPNSILSTEGGIDDDCKVRFKCNDMHFVVILSIKSPADSFERKFIRLFQELMKPDGDEEAYQKLEEMEDSISMLCQPIFQKYAPCIPYQPRTLYDHMYLQTLQLQLVTLDGEVKIRVLDGQDGPQQVRPTSYHCEGLDLSKFKPSDLEVNEVIKEGKVFKVAADGSFKCAKVIGHQISTKSMRREISILQRVSNASKTKRICIPAPKGIIVHEDDPNQVLGLLMEYISPRPGTQGLESCSQASPEARLTWVEEITAMLARLHDLGVVWGDAKAGNTILDEENNLWLVDFGGGGWTDGWIDPNKAESVAGDLQGLQRIVEHLRSHEDNGQTYTERKIL